MATVGTVGASGLRLNGLQAAQPPVGRARPLARTSPGACERSSFSSNVLDPHVRVEGTCAAVPPTLDHPWSALPFLSWSASAPSGSSPSRSRHWPPSCSAGCSSSPAWSSGPGVDGPPASAWPQPGARWCWLPCSCCCWSMPARTIPSSSGPTPGSLPAVGPETRYSSTSSIRVPNAAFGWMKATVVPRLPGRGWSSITRPPASFTACRAAAQLSTR